MPQLTPLRFRPVLKQYLWGGRRLGTLLGKPIGEGDDWAESWEVVDHDDDQSVVAAGPLAGKTLGELVRDEGQALLGKHFPQRRFPLLLKLLDCNKTLSVQVHPDDAQAARLDPPDLGKTEAWVVLDAAPGSVIYAGLKRGFDRHALEREVARGTCELCLHQIEPQVGECVFIPAGLVHALGAGLVVAELQQASDTTFRLFDWNRVDKHGQPRPLHVEQALAVIDFEHGPAEPQVPQATDRPGTQRLVECDKFVWDRWQIDAPQTVGGDGGCRIVLVVQGQVDVAGDPSGQPLGRGQTVLLAAELGPVELRPQGPAVLLEARLP